MFMNNKTSSASSSLAPRPLRLRIETQADDVRVEIIPLIDVVFCILIFFILAAVSFARQQAISVDLPTATTGTPQGRELLVVSLDELGQVYVEQDPVVTREQFLQKLREYRQQNPNGLMTLYASSNASYSDVVQVLDLLRSVGGDRVALATLPGDSGQTPRTTTPQQPPATGVPGFSPYPGATPIDPYGLQNPANPLNPNLPQTPGYPGLPQPGLPGIPPGTSPNNLQPSPGQLDINPGTATPAPGGTTAPQLNPATPGSSVAPTPGGVTAP